MFYLVGEQGDLLRDLGCLVVVRLHLLVKCLYFCVLLLRVLYQAVLERTRKVGSRCVSPLLLRRIAGGEKKSLSIEI